MASIDPSTRREIQCIAMDCSPDEPIVSICGQLYNRITVLLSNQPYNYNEIISHITYANELYGVMIQAELENNEHVEHTYEYNQWESYNSIVFHELGLGPS